MEDKTWFFLHEDGRIRFTVTIEHAEDEPPPEDLIELIELYSQGYRRKDCPWTKSGVAHDPDPFHT